MIRLDRRARGLAICLAALAGYVDAIGFIQIGGFFVSFMSGNSTRLAVGLFEHAASWQKAAGLIFSFFIGVVSGSLVGRRARRRHRAVLTVVTLALTSAALAAGLGWVLPAALVLAFAMGAENATFERDGQAGVALTYMTGAFVKAGQGLASVLAGEKGQVWLPHLGLWGALISGAVTGAACQGWFGAASLWGAVAASAGCWIAAGALDRDAGESTASQA